LRVVGFFFVDIQRMAPSARNEATLSGFKFSGIDLFELTYPSSFFGFVERRGALVLAALDAFAISLHQLPLVRSAHFG